jgi:hypothetical protein
MADYDHSLTANIPRILVEAVPGEALSVTLPILDSANAAVAIASAVGWEVLAQLRAQPSSSTVLHTFTTDSPVNASVTTGAAGAVVLSATATQTAAWQTTWTNSPQVAVGDVFVTDDQGVPRCIADLVVALLPRVTRG